MKPNLISTLLATSLCFSAACSDEMKGAPSSEATVIPSEAPVDAEAIHRHALVLDAHADIEIPGQESRYVGKDGLSKVSPEKMRAGGVDAVVMAGWPGSRAAAWQRAGRAGRRQGTSLALVVASSSPVDQFVAADPDYLCGQAPEHARIDPDNAAALERIETMRAELK